MTKDRPKISVLSSSQNLDSRSKAAALFCKEVLDKNGCVVDFIDLNNLELLPYPRSEQNQEIKNACNKFNNADGWVLASPVYNFGASGTLLTFLHYALAIDSGAQWKPFCIVASMNSMSSRLATDHLARSLMLERNAVAVGPTIISAGENIKEMSVSLRTRIEKQMKVLAHFVEARTNLQEW